MDVYPPPPQSPTTVRSDKGLPRVRRVSGPLQLVLQSCREHVESFPLTAV